MGFNIAHFFELQDLFDLGKLEVNCPNTFAKYYGVEGGRNCLISELKKVISHYGIAIDDRHYQFVADRMCQGGFINPMSRSGIDSLTSPILKMSFETSMNFLKKATFWQKIDNCGNPSANILLG